MSKLWRLAGDEPAIDEMIADPIVELVMRRDGVDEAALRRTLAEAGAALLEESEAFAADMASAGWRRRP
jgi:hypothetical protein